MMLLIGILSAALYIVMGIVVGLKQFRVAFDKGGLAEGDAQAQGFVAGIFWPIVLIVYIFRAVFFEPWI